MTGAKEMVLVSSTKLLVLFGIFLAVVVVLLIVIGCLDYEVSKLRKDNKMLHRVLEDYYRLEDGRIRAAQAINREAERASWLPPGW